MSRVYRPRLGWIILYLAMMVLNALYAGLVAMKGLWLFVAVGLAAAACFAACTILTLSDCRVRWRAGYMPQASDGMKTIKGKA